MEVYPFHHKNLFFRIITDCDLAFEEVRGILDYLLEAGAFQEEADLLEGGEIYDIQVGGASYAVDVHSYEVVIFQKNQP